MPTSREVLNDSVMGSVFTRYETPAYVNLDWEADILEGANGNEADFAALVGLVADGAGLELVPENVEIEDGLSPLEPVA